MRNAAGQERGHARRQPGQYVAVGSVRSQAGADILDDSGQRCRQLHGRRIGLRRRGVLKRQAVVDRIPRFRQQRAGGEVRAIQTGGHRQSHLRLLDVDRAVNRRHFGHETAPIRQPCTGHKGLGPIGHGARQEGVAQDVHF